MTIERPDPHGKGFYGESKDFCRHYLSARLLANEKDREEREAADREVTAERERNRQTAGGLYY